MKANSLECKLSTLPHMPDIEFGKDGKCVFPTKYHGEVTLSKTKWDIICSEPERHYYRFNGEKIATTLINPDIVRHHKAERNQVLYYKKFLRICSDRGVELSWYPGIFFAVWLTALHQESVQYTQSKSPKLENCLYQENECHRNRSFRTVRQGG
jgi:hypothetical protein